MNWTGCERKLPWPNLSQFPGKNQSQDRHVFVFCDAEDLKHTVTVPVFTLLRNLLCIQM